MRKLKESETVELKKSTSEIKQAMWSIAAILTKHQHGKLYFGVKDNGDVIGQQVSNKTLRTVSQAIANHIKPQIFPTIKEVTIKGKQCILIEFSVSGKDVYYAYGRAYTRVGETDKQLTPKEVERLILERNRHKLQWDKETSDKKLKDINTKLLKNFIKRANAVKRINFKFTDTKSTLNKLNLTKKNKLLNAAEVLFCDDNLLEVQAAVFAGKDKLTFIDISQFKGNIFSLIEES